MSLDFWWLEDRTATTQRVSFRVTANHTVGANGTTVAIVAATADGTGYVDVPVTAAAGTLSITVDGVATDTGSYPAFAAPTDTFTLGVASCQSQDYEFLAGHWLKDQCDILVHTGDWVYETEAFNQWGESGMTSCITNPTQANWFQHHRQPHRNPGWKHLGHQVPIYKIEDDHDILDRYDRTDTASMALAIDAYVAANGGTRAAAQTAIEGFAFAAIDAYRHQGSPYYYAFNYGAARVIVPNLMRYTDPVSSPDPKTRMGATQLAWFKTELSNAATFKIVITSKVLFNGANDDGWYPDPNNSAARPGYLAELADIMAYIKTNSIKGILWMEGDTHMPMVNHLTPQMVATKLGGVASSYDHVVAFNPTPSGKIQDHSVTAGVADGVIWKKQASGVASNLHGDAVVGRVIVTPTYMQPEIWSISGKRIGYGIIDAASNQMRHGWFLDN